MLRLSPPLVLSALILACPSCIIVVDADAGELGYVTRSLREPGFYALTEDLDEIGWEIQEIERDGHDWLYEIESVDGEAEAELRVHLGPGRRYEIEELEIQGRGDAIQALSGLAGPRAHVESEAD